MITPPYPNDEVRRFEALESLGVLFAPSEARFDRITALAARLLDVPIMLVSLVGAQRQWFKSKHGREVARRDRDDLLTGLLLLDIDRFKTIKDSHGLVVGDAVILEAAHRMRSSVRPYDAIGRYGGDEFLVVLSDCDARTAQLRRAEEIKSQ